MPLMVDIPVEKQVELLATLKLQHAALVARGCITSKSAVMACRMSASAPSYYFCNNFYGATQAFASTRVVIKQHGHQVKTSVQVKRNSSGELMDALVLKGPSYKLNCTTPATDALITHASTCLFQVYTTIMHAVHGSAAPPVPLPQLPFEVVDVKFDHDAAVASSLPLFQALPCAPVAPPAPTTPTLASPASATPTLASPASATPTLASPASATPVPASPAPPTPVPASPERPTKRQRTGAERSTCYICFKPKRCDILFPCRVASHACCRKCIKRLYEMWSSDEYEGQATIKCPQCNHKDGLVQRTDGKVIWLGHRYVLRKKRRLSYAPVDE